MKAGFFWLDHHGNSRRTWSEGGYVQSARLDHLLTAVLVHYSATFTCETAGKKNVIDAKSLIAVQQAVETRGAITIVQTCVS